MALITTEGRNELTALYVAMINVAPGGTSLSTMVASAEGGKTLAQIAADLAKDAGFAANFPGFMTGQEFADKLVLKLLPSTTPAAALTWSTNWVTSQLNGGKSRAQVITEAVLALRASTLTNYADAKAQLANKVDVSLYYAITKTQAADSASAVASVTANAATATAAKTALDSSVTSGSFGLTANTDTLLGDSGNNTFNGSAGFTVGDSVDGVSGIDTLVLTMTGVAPTATIKNIDILNITASPNPASIALTGVTGITDINNVSSANGATLTVTGVDKVANTSITGTNSATTITYADAAVIGLADASTLTLVGTAAGASFVTAGVETLTVKSTSAANTLSLTDTGITKLVITGDQALTITNAVGASTLATVDAAAATGAVTLITGAGPTASGVAVTAPTAAVAFNLTTSSGKDTITLGAGASTVVSGSGNDTITTGAGANLVTPGTGNDTLTLGAGVDTVRYNEVGATDADTINGFSTTDVLSFNLGTVTAAATTTSAATTLGAGIFGIVQTGATAPTLAGVSGLGASSAIVFQSVSPATSAANTIAQASNVVALNGYTDGTAAGLFTALGTTGTTGVTTAQTGKFLLVTYSVGNIAQVWQYTGDSQTAGVLTDIDAAELSLVATLNNVALNSLTAANFSTYQSAGATTTTVSNSGQTITISTPLSTVSNVSNTAGQYFTAAADTVNVNLGMLPTNTATATMGLTLIDSATGDADVLNASVLSATWDAGTTIVGIENVNLTMIATDAALVMSTTMPTTTSLTVLGSQDLSGVSGITSGTAFGLGAGYANTLTTAGGTLAAGTLNLNGTAGTSAATSPMFVSNLFTALTVNANATTTVRADNAATGVWNATNVTMSGANGVTIYGTAAQFGATAMNASGVGYTGALTLRPSSNAAMDFSDTSALTGVRAINLSDIAAYNTQITMNASNNSVAYGTGALGVSFAPTASSALAGLLVTMPGAGQSDALAVTLGSSATGITAGVNATGFETLTVSTSQTASTTIGGITLFDGAGAQTVTVTGPAGATGTTSLGAVIADTINTAGVSNTVTVSLAGNTAGASFTGGTGNTTVTGSTAGDSITTGSGADTVNASTGNDLINLGGGNDQITGAVIFGAGAQVNGGTGTDTIIWTTPIVNVNTPAFIGVEQIVVGTTGTYGFVGSAVTGQAIAFNEIAEVATTLAFNATAGGTVNLSSLTFAAITYGATGGSQGILISAATDTITLSAAGGTVAAILTGPSLATTITGTSLADTITGGAGVDTIVGGQGADRITTAGGADRVTVATAAASNTTDGIDSITDFTAGTDILALAVAAAGTLNTGSTNADLSTNSADVASTGTTVTTLLANLQTASDALGANLFDHAGDTFMVKITGASFAGTDVSYVVQNTAADTNVTAADTVIALVGTSTTALTVATVIAA